MIMNNEVSDVPKLGLFCYTVYLISHRLHGGMQILLRAGRLDRQ